MFHNFFLSIEILPLYMLIVYIVISKDIFINFMFLLSKNDIILLLKYILMYLKFEYKTILKNGTVETFKKKTKVTHFAPTIKKGGITPVGISKIHNGKYGKSIEP